MGEIGVLLHVEADDPGGSVLVVIPRKDGTTTAGVLSIRPDLRARVVAVLQAYPGRPLTEVGGAEIPEA